MAFTISFSMICETLSNEFLRQLPYEDYSYKISQNMGQVISLTGIDKVHAYTFLKLMRCNSNINKIIVHNDDGWECDEIDLMSTEDLESLSEEISREDTKEQPKLTASNLYVNSINTVSNSEINDRYFGASKPSRSSYRLILASQSPRRQELLSLIGIPFTAEAADIDENSITEELKLRFNCEPFSIMAALIVMNLAKAKAQKLLNFNPDAIVIGSDTIVTIDESILGKPSSPDDAFTMLKSLAGHDHHVYTGVSLISNEREETFFTVTRVGFFPWSSKEEELARRYIATGSPLDKAGAYGIQDMGALFIRGIKGDYYTVMGLPVSEVYRRLQKFEVS